MAVDAGQWLAQHAAKGAGGTVFNPDHLGHRQARRIHAVQAGRNEHVAHQDIGVGRHEAQVEQSALAASIRHAAQAIAQHLHRDGLFLVGQQRHFGGEREYARDLPHHALAVDHRQADPHIAMAAAVDDDLAGRGVARVVQDFGHHRAHRQRLARAEQFAQLGVFNHLKLGQLHALRGGNLGDAQVAHLLLQGRKRRKITAGAGQRIARDQGGHLQGVEHGAGHHANRLEHFDARIDHQ